MPGVPAPTTVAILGVGLVIAIARPSDVGVRGAGGGANAREVAARAPEVSAERAASPEQAGAATPVVQGSGPSAESEPEDERDAIVIEEAAALARFEVPRDRMALEVATGATSAARFSASEATLVALIASWCAPCADELPALFGFSRERGVALVLVVLDEVAGPESLQAVVEDMLAEVEPVSQALPAVMLRADPDGAWSEATAPVLAGRGEPGALPQTLLFGGDGRARALVQGSFSGAIGGRLAEHLATHAEARP